MTRAPGFTRTEPRTYRWSLILGLWWSLAQTQIRVIGTYIHTYPATITAETFFRPLRCIVLSLLFRLCWPFEFSLFYYDSTSLSHALIRVACLHDPVGRADSFLSLLSDNGEPTPRRLLERFLPTEKEHRESSPTRILTGNREAAPQDGF